MMLLLRGIVLPRLLASSFRLWCAETVSLELLLPSPFQSTWTRVKVRLRLG